MYVTVEVNLDDGVGPQKKYTSPLFPGAYRTLPQHHCGHSHQINSFPHP